MTCPWRTPVERSSGVEDLDHRGYGRCAGDDRSLGDDTHAQLDLRDKVNSADDHRIRRAVLAVLATLWFVLASLAFLSARRYEQECFSQENGAQPMEIANGE